MQEFYLIVLPFLYWNVEWLLGHHLLFVTCVGLFLGNFLKVSVHLGHCSLLNGFCRMYFNCRVPVVCGDRRKQPPQTAPAAK